MATILPSYCQQVDELQKPMCTNAKPKAFEDECPPDCTCTGNPNPDDPTAPLGGLCARFPDLCAGSDPNPFPWFQGFLDVQCRTIQGTYTLSNGILSDYITVQCFEFMTYSGTGSATEQDAATGLNGSGPAITVTLPAPNASVSGSMVVAGSTVAPTYGVNELGAWVDNLPVSLGGLAIHLPSSASCTHPLGGTDPNCPNIDFSGTLDTSTLSNGPHTLSIVALSARSPYPVPTLYTLPFQVNNQCASATPAVSVTTPSNGDTVSGTTSVTVAPTDSVPIVQVSLYVDGAIVTTWSAPPYTYAWNTAGLAPGVHTLQARMKDSCGNTAASSTLSVHVASPVKLYIDAPAPNATISGTAYLSSGWATDANRIASLTFALDGGPCRCCRPTPTASDAATSAPPIRETPTAPTSAGAPASTPRRTRTAPIP